MRVLRGTNMEIENQESTKTLQTLEKTNLDRQTLYTTNPTDIINLKHNKP